MASAKKTTAPEMDESIKALLDSALAGESISDKDTIALIGLTPIYSPKEALADNWPALVGDVDRIELLPTQLENTTNEWTPVMVRFVLSQPTKAVTGTKLDRKIVDLKAGDAVLLPIKGTLGVNRKLEACAADSKNVHRCIVIVTGTEPNRKGNDMFLFEVREIPSKMQPRAGVFAAPLTVLTFDAEKALAILAARAMQGAADAVPASNGALQA